MSKSSKIFVFSNVKFLPRGNDDPDQPPRPLLGSDFGPFWTDFDPPQDPDPTPPRPLPRPRSDPWSDPWSDPPPTHGFWVRKPYFYLSFSVKNGHFWGHFQQENGPSSANFCPIELILFIPQFYRFENKNKRNWLNCVVVWKP